MKFGLALLVFFLIALLAGQLSLARVVDLTVPIEFPNEKDLSSFFRCDDTKYILKDCLCDGIEDCFDGTDEEFCFNYLEAGVESLEYVQ